MKKLLSKTLSFVTILGTAAPSWAIDVIDFRDADAPRREFNRPGTPVPPPPRFPDLNDRRNDRNDRRNDHDDGRWNDGRNNDWRDDHRNDRRDDYRHDRRTRTKVVNLNYRGQTFRNQSIHLKRELMEQLGRRYDLNDYDLKEVRLLAKADRNGAVADLVVNGTSQNRRPIYGDSRRYRNDDVRGYSETILRNYDDRDRGRWVLRIDGTAQILNISVVIEEEDNDYRPLPPRPVPIPHLTYYSIGEDRAETLTIDDKDFRVDFSNRTYAVRITSQDGDLEVRDVVVTTSRGDRIRLHQLSNRTLRKGDWMIDTSLIGEEIVKVSVSASTPGLFGGRTRYSVELGTLR